MPGNDGLDNEYGVMHDIVFIISCAENENAPGTGVSGGIKLQNDWVKLLRRNRYETYRATLDGTYQPWMLWHAPTVSLEQCQVWQREGRNLRWIIPWLAASAALEVADQFYYFEAEMAYTLDQFSARVKKYQPRVLGWATNSRYQQARYMLEFGITPTLIVGNSDTYEWFPNPDRRIPHRVGYMFEGPESDHDIQYIQAVVQAHDLSAEFVQITGLEREVRNLMQTCDIFLGLNPGKHPVWGEACPRSQHEAMHCGCVVIAYDVLGNREYLYHGHTGYLIPRGQPDQMADQLVEVLTHPEQKERVRAAGHDFVLHACNLWRTWPQMKEWLQL
jgi:hypothetical protein